MLVDLDLVRLLETFLVAVELVKHNNQQILRELDRLAVQEEAELETQELVDQEQQIQVVAEELEETLVQNYLELVDQEQW
tara:strand:+ start:215 stop:454 length:240 start_codon:yes stop_codon:yes gene_type:complete